MLAMNALEKQRVCTTQIETIAGTATFRSTSIFAYDLAARLRPILDRVNPKPEPEAVTAPHPQPAPDGADLLRKLAELRDQGILSEEEFQAKKAEILARI